MAVDPAVAIALSSAMTSPLLDSLSLDEIQEQKVPAPNLERVEAAILSIASDLQTVLGEALATAIIIYTETHMNYKIRT